MNSKLKTLILCFWIVSTNELHITNRTLKNDKLVTLDILGRDSFVVDLEPDHDLYDHNNVEEDIELEPRECPPCLCLLEHDERDRENYIVADEIDLPKPVTPVSSSTTTSTLTTVKLIQEPLGVSCPWKQCLGRAFRLVMVGDSNMISHLRHFPCCFFVFHVFFCFSLSLFLMCSMPP